MAAHDTRPIRRRQHRWTPCLAASPAAIARGSPLVLCAEGYRPKRLPNCNQICVPDSGAECTTDTDCGTIYCITSPCDQPVCRGRQCVLDPTPDPAAGEPCGDIRCGASSYCCDPSCRTCAPDGYACTLGCAAL